MNDSLTEIQGDIQRLNSQQHQIQSIMHNGNNQQPQGQNQFYLHDQVSIFKSFNLIYKFFKHRKVLVIE